MAADGQPFCLHAVDPALANGVRPGRLDTDASRTNALDQSQALIGNPIYLPGIQENIFTLASQGDPDCAAETADDHPFGSNHTDRPIFCQPQFAICQIDLHIYLHESCMESVGRCRVVIQLQKNKIVSSTVC